MRTYLIGYDLPKEPVAEYENLIQAIKSQFPAWWHGLDSTWIVKADLSAADVRDRLLRHIRHGDRLLVAQLCGDVVWSGFEEQTRSWLSNNL